MKDPLFTYWPLIHRPPLKWPNGARVAIWVAANVEHYLPDRPGLSYAPSIVQPVPDPLSYGWRDYGPRVGIWRLMEVLDKHGIRASVLLNSDVCKYYPVIIEEGNRRKWVWLAHGKNNSTMQANMTREAERSYLTEMTDSITVATGQRPRGWLGPALTETFDTPTLLAELGFTYLCDWCNDDQPYPLSVPGYRMISMPYSTYINDVTLMVGKNLRGEDFYQMVVDQFEVLDEEGAKQGRVMAIVVHPFVINQPFWHKYLDRALGFIAQQPGAWITTSDDISDWYYQHLYDAAVASIGKETAPNPLARQT